MHVQSNYKAQSLPNAQTNKKLTLSKGQIVKGTIEQLHPDQIATIKIGNSRVAAKLEVPVEKGNSYVFEVLTSGDIPELKMVEQQSVKNDVPLSKIIKSMGLPVTKEAEQLLRQLLKENIPVKPQQFKAALEIFSKQPNANIKATLVNMIKHQLPLSTETVMAYSRLLEQTPSMLIDALITELGNLMPTDQLNQLMDKLTMIKTPITMPHHQAVPMTQQQQEAFVQLFNQKAIISTEPSSVSNVLTQLMNKQLGLQNEEMQSLKQWVASDRLPLNQQERDLFFMQNRSQMLQANPELQASEDAKIITKEMIQTTLLHIPVDELTLIEKTVSEQTLGMEKVQAFLKENPSAFQKIVQQLPSDVQTLLHQLIENPKGESSRSLQQALKQLFDQQFASSEYKMLIPLAKETGVIQTLPVEQQFILGVKDYLLQSGLNYEQQLMESTDQSLTLKHMLLEVQQSTQAKIPALDSLIQSLSDQQLAIVKQDEHFIHYGIALPISTDENQDVYLEMYGQKTETETLNPDYCRIAFYLTLSSLGETIVDLSIQNRLIQLTVINNQDLADILEPLKPQLKEGLARIDYQLTSVHYRPFKDKETVVTNKETYKSMIGTDQKRWDVRA